MVASSHPGNPKRPGKSLVCLKGYQAVDVMYRLIEFWDQKAFHWIVSQTLQFWWFGLNWMNLVKKIQIHQVHKPFFGASEFLKPMWFLVKKTAEIFGNIEKAKCFTFEAAWRKSLLFFLPLKVTHRLIEPKIPPWNFFLWTPYRRKPKGHNFGFFREMSLFWAKLAKNVKISQNLNK